MKIRLLAALLALPLVAFDCGGNEEEQERSPFGQICRLTVGGAAPETMWCIVAAYDYSQGPMPLDEWGFILTAYRDTMEVGAGAGVYLDGPPSLGIAYGWTGATRTAGLTEGGAIRYGGSMQQGTFGPTHEADSLAETGSLSVTFTRIPPAGAPEQAIDVHGTLTAELPSTTAGDPVTFSVTF